MSGPPAISLVCCDLASIVIDGSVVERAFAEAIATQGIVAGTQDYTRSMVRLDRARGRPPADVLRDLFENDEPRGQVSVLVGGHRLAPQVEVGALRLDLPPYRETAKHQQGKDEQLLH